MKIGSLGLIVKISLTYCIVQIPNFILGISLNKMTNLSEEERSKSETSSIDDP